MREMTTTQEVHSLRFALLTTQRRTGEILMDVKNSGNYDDFIARHRITADDAEVYITLHSQWEYVQAAIEWCQQEGRPHPTSAEEALHLLGPWKRTHIN